MTLEAVAAFLDTHAYWFFIAVGFAEFIGIPVVSEPVIVAGGAIAASGAIELPAVVIAVAVGGLLADLSWYWIARVRGQGLVDAACGLSSNPRACVLGVKSRLTRLGVPLAKLLPGAGNLVAPAAGLAGLPARTFFVADTVSLLLWGTLDACLGWIFQSQVESAIGWVLIYSRGAVAVGVGAIPVASLLRV